MKKLILSVMLICIVLLIGTSVLAEDYVFTSEITESQKELTVTLSISPSVRNSFFIINAYTNNKVVAHKLVKADTLTKQVVLKCKAKPDDVRVNIWSNLVNVKPVIDTVKYEKTENNSVQEFTPTESFPADFSYVEGVVYANEKTSINSNTQMQKDYIKILSAENTYTTIYAPGINTDKYLGRNVVVAFDNDNVLKNINETENSSVFIDTPTDIQLNGKYASFIIPDDTGSSLSGILSVYDDEFNATNTEYKLDNATIIYNNTYLSSYLWDSVNSYNGNLGTYLMPVCGNLELIDNDSDGLYECIFVKSYETKIVDYIFDNNTKIATKAGSTIDLTTFLQGNDGYTYSITLNNKNLDITELKENDILSVSASANGRNIDIMVSRDVIEGPVEAIDTYIDKLQDVYQLAGEKYSLSAFADTNNYPQITLQTEGYFHLDVFGRIAMVSSYPLTHENLAYLIEYGDYQSYGETHYQFKLLDKYGSVKVYETASSVYFTRNNNTHQLPESFLSYELTSALYDVGSRLITYKTNANDEITALCVSSPNVSNGMCYNTVTGTYSKELNGFNYISIKDDAIIFYAPSEVSDREYEIVSSAVFEDGKNYTVSLYDVNSDLYSSVAVIHSEIPCISPESIATVISSEITNGILTLKVLQDGTEKTLSFAKNCNYNTSEGNLFSKGTTFRYTLNHNGLIKEIYDENFVFNSVTDTSLGFVEAVGNYQQMGESVYQIKLFNKYGNHITYKLSNRLPVKVNGVRKKIVSGALTEERGVSYASDVAYYLDNLISSGNYANRLISYVVDAYGYITSINMSTEGTGEGMQYKTFDEAYPFTGANISDDAIVFYLPEEGDESEYEIAPASAFKETKKYYAYAFNINSDLYSDLVIVTTTMINEASFSFATVTKSAVNNGNIIVTFIQDGEEKTLMLAKDCAYNIPDNNLFTVGTTFRYSLNLKGEIKEIFDENFVISSIADTKIAFIKNFGTYEDYGNTCYEIELFNKDGSICVYKLANRVSIKTNTETARKIRANEVAAMINSLLQQEKNTTNYANRIISYIANKDGEIISITFPDNNAGEGLSISGGSTTDKYDATTSSLKYGITDKTIIFYIPVSDWDGKVIDISALNVGYTYDTAYLDIDGNNAGIVIITNITKEMGSTPLAVVIGSTIVTNSAGESVIQVSFLQNNEEYTLYVDEESYLNDIYYNVFKRGSIFEYTLNFEGEIEDAKFCGLSCTEPLTWQEVKESVNSFPTQTNGNRNYEYIGGYVVNKNASILTLSQDFTQSSGNRVVIPNTANIYAMDVSRSKILPQISSLGDITPVKHYEDFGDFFTEAGLDTYVLIKYIDDKITDVIVYNGFEPNTQIW